MEESESLIKLDKKLETIYPNNSRHRMEASNGVFCTCLRNEIDPIKLINDVENNVAFDFDKFSKANSGNLLDFLHKDYHSIAQMLIDVTAGGNGGMGNIGRCEFFISFMSNFKAVISTEGHGDLKCENKYEEVKYHGGKITIEKIAGNEIHRTFIDLLEAEGFELKQKDYVFNRNSNKRCYTESEICKLNGYYWTAITGEYVRDLTNREWTLKAISRGFNNLFAVTNSLLLVNIDNDFVRFFSAGEAIEFYESKLDLMMNHFELRMHQANVPAFYVGKNEIN